MHTFHHESHKITYYVTKVFSIHRQNAEHLWNTISCCKCIDSHAPDGNLLVAIFARSRVLNMTFHGNYIIGQYKRCFTICVWNHSFNILYILGVVSIPAIKKCQQPVSSLTSDKSSNLIDMSKTTFLRLNIDNYGSDFKLGALLKSLKYLLLIRSILYGR